jgi:hypothetical protein
MSKAQIVILEKELHGIKILVYIELYKNSKYYASKKD